jgi:hypothetical protein
MLETSRWETQVPRSRERVKSRAGGHVMTVNGAPRRRYRGVE